MATNLPRRVLFEGVESVRFRATRVPEQLPSLEKLGSMTVTNAIQAVLLHARRPLTVFEIAAELKKRGFDVKMGQYELFSTILQYITSANQEIYGFQKV
ncbi:MAG TPA: hypothetical protein VD969_23380 [Symbiobacteriaceae bacterium]|nr:hypothetical protein [Symbiobacteriaceae bacterium]